MAYVVARRNGRFEIRESLHTARGPRAHTLAGFRTLTDGALAAAAQRAQRPFHAEAVIDSARRAGAGVQLASSAPARERFLAGSRRMARALARRSSPSAYAAPGEALIELLGFADAVAVALPTRPFEPLAFPVLARLAVAVIAGR